MISTVELKKLVSLLRKRVLGNHRNPNLEAANMIIGPHEQILNVEQFSDIHLVPLLEEDGPDRQRGGCLKNRQALDCASQLRGRKTQYITTEKESTWSLDERQEPTRLSGTWMFGGFWLHHFGHFVSETAPRLWPLLQEIPPKIEGVVFIGGASDSPESPQQNREVIDILSGEVSYPIKICNTPWIVEKLLVPSQASTLGPLSEPSNYYLELLKRHQLNKPCKEHKNIYVSRSKIKSTSRLIGERFIESILKEAGYFICHPQEYPIKEQLNMYASAESLIFCEGSAIHGAELLGEIQADCYILSRGGLRSHRLRAMSSILRKRSKSLTVFSDVRRHSPLKYNINALGESVPAHWESGVWITYEALTNILNVLKIPDALHPSRSKYSEALKVEALDYLLDANEEIDQWQLHSIKGLETFLTRLHIDTRSLD